MAHLDAQDARIADMLGDMLTANQSVITQSGLFIIADCYPFSNSSP